MWHSQGGRHDAGSNKPPLKSQSISTRLHGAATRKKDFHTGRRENLNSEST
jgi:hypothetical protein